ncbi:palmitoyltransferase PFA4 [Lachancea thermotolerans CBS 6340]|uniref:Palmitoyltransferase PFA4 n=1 Tax=Lachancea thermotolerans (strain ATCC 56472 / CBS 6340 / NRRL Y-8284) TaxID=559295 RepID=C5DEP7_LACTC|nr:KLTH0C10978p [Lachancea thermotolerans CBS 6340]CAR22258.1 KLTH0C10978p [Lachancea thermotolerans CBS 6340]
MPVELKWPWLGIAVPSFLIAYIGYSSHYFILQNFASTYQQLWFEFSLTLIWVSYAFAIFKNPGRPPPNFEPPIHQWKNYCKKCDNYKPERTHHCKTCKQCVLSMDHHCPWTMNCVGHNNFPHFVRFLTWVVLTTSYLGLLLTQRAFDHWASRNTRKFVHTSELCFLFVNAPLNAFILLTVSLLVFRCVKNQFLNGMTQIESWEKDRIENLFFNERLVPQLIDNLKELFPEDTFDEGAAQKLLSSKQLELEDIINFPYDVDILENMKSSMGPIYSWCLPCGRPRDEGTRFVTNDLSDYDIKASIEDKLLSLPWPPDGGRQKSQRSADIASTLETFSSGGEATLRNRSFDSRISVPRTEWHNDWGENLSDFGVDVDAET